MGGVVVVVVRGLLPTPKPTALLTVCVVFFFFTGAPCLRLFVPLDV